MPLNIPIVNCGSNSSLDALKNKVGALKDAINGSLEGLQNDLSDSLSSIKDGLSGLVPSSPALRDFKADLMSLAGKTGLALQKAKAQLNELWGGAVGDLESLMDAVSNPLSGFNICKDAPAVKATTNADGTLTPVVEAQESPAPAVNPSKPAKVTPTVERKAELPSSTGSGVSHEKASSDYRVYEVTKAASYDKLIVELESLNVKTAQLANTAAVKKAQGANDSTVSKWELNANNRLRKGLITKAEYDQYVVWKKTDNERALLQSAVVALADSFQKWESYHFGYGDQNIANLRGFDKSSSKTLYPAQASYFSKPEEITTANAAILKAYGATLKG